MAWPPNLHSPLTALRLTLAIALMAVASTGYVVFVAPAGAPSSLDSALALRPQR